MIRTLDIEDFLSADYIDSRDIERRIEDLEDEIIPAEDGTLGAHPDAELNQELEDLRAFRDEASGYSDDWLYGAQLIADEAFITYTQDYASDVGAVGQAISQWPLMHIDWAAAAEDLKQDYTEVTLRGRDYWVR